MTPRTTSTTATTTSTRTSSRLAFRWRLRQVMADREMFATSDLAPLLAERGIDLSAAQIYRLVTTAPERLNMQILVALCDALGVTPNDLIELHALEPDPTGANHRRDRSRDNGPVTAGDAPARPTRARITRDPS
jgi:DNA-binding Xre family transcriptional regulator